ncbi:MAG: twin-arginine translocase TatA/TatE family subunit [Deltaproteobacteria bacterium]|nr:twin-arginine translocase TatA/TatE family subunit [Deltaproteobacteria bacterium]
MPNLHWGELLLILLIVLVIFGASRLPMIGEGLGKAIRGFKRSMSEREDIEVKQVPPESSAERVPPAATKKKPKEVEAETED